MDHGLMLGMLIGGVLLSLPPLALGVVLCVLGVRAYRSEQAAERGET